MRIVRWRVEPKEETTMEIGVVVRYGGVMPGREAACVDLFTETLSLYGEKLADGTFTSFEPFAFRTGDFQEELGFFVLKGPEEKVTGFFNSMEQRTLQAKGEQIVNHLKIEFLYTGSEVLEQVQIMAKLVGAATPALVD